MPPRYRITWGDGLPFELDGYSRTVDYARDLVMDMHLPDWRELALLSMLENMPNAGLTFTDQAGQIIKIERT